MFSNVRRKGIFLCPFYLSKRNPSAPLRFGSLWTDLLEGKHRFVMNFLRFLLLPFWGYSSISGIAF
jgi:hypothetical protein